MRKNELISSEEVLAQLNENPEFQKEARKLNPYFELVVEIINRRNKLGLSQKELAARAGTFQSRISKIESAEFDVRLSTLIEIAEALNTKLHIKMVPIEEIPISENDELYKQLFTVKSVISRATVLTNPVNLTIK